MHKLADEPSAITGWPQRPAENHQAIRDMKKFAATALAVVMRTLAAAAVLTPARAGGPSELVVTTDKGQHKNPLTITPELIEEGKALYQAKTCGACHGGNGGGIHRPSLKNDAWIYGSDDDTLFRLVAVGSEAMLANGYSRGDKEKHAGPMPGFLRFDRRRERTLEDYRLHQIAAACGCRQVASPRCAASAKR